jgi:ribosomal protein L37AE/L43A
MFQQLHHGDGCPQCKEGELERIARKNWMRQFPQSKHYICPECSTRFLTIHGRLFKKLSKDEEFTKFRRKKIIEMTERDYMRD